MKVIIVGGVAGGASCAARLRRLDEKAEILMVERGPYVSYGNCGLPYHVGGVIEKESKLLVTDANTFRSRFAVDVRTDCEAVRIAPEKNVDYLADALSIVAARRPDVVAEVAGFLEARLQAVADLGIAGPRVVLDPGIGFGKTVEQNLKLLANLGRLQRLGRPVCLGVSRKGFLGQVLDRPQGQRLAGSLAAACYALAHGTAHIIRAHDVAQTRDAIVLFRLLDELRG